MMASGGVPISLVALADGKRGTNTWTVLYCFNEEYYEEEWAREYMGDVVRIMHDAFNGITAPPPTKPSDWVMPIGIADFSDKNRHERNQHGHVKKRV
jgi:hypothetical protein